MLNVDCESGLSNRGITYREMIQWVQETGQEVCEQRHETGDRKQNGGKSERLRWGFVVFTYGSRIFAGRVAQVKKC
jgi:hypothetical protein